MNPFLNKYIKTINPEDLPAEAWNIVLGRRDENSAQELYKSVGWMFRAMEIRCNGVMSVPFSIYQGETEIDTSKDYQNAVGFLPNLNMITGLIEMALTIWGSAYLYKRPNLLGTRPFMVRYLPPPTVNIKRVEGSYAFDDNGMPLFERREAGAKKEYTSDEIAFFWKADPFVELGPPEASAFQSASLAAGVSLDVNAFVSAFLQRGAIVPFILTVRGVKKNTELDKLKDFVARFFVRDRKKSWPTEVVNADEVIPVKIGEGLEAIAGKEAMLGNSKREEIATALGIPHSILFSGAANYAVSDKDDFHLYDKTIVPECLFIEQIMNNQLMTPAGYRLKYHPEALDVFQKDEGERAAALSDFMDAMIKAETFEMAEAMFSIFGYEVSDEALNLLKKHFEKKAEDKEKFAANLTGGQPGKKPGVPPEDEEDEDPGVKEELGKWMSKIRKRWNPKTKTADQIEFVPEQIPPGLHGAISGQLENCKTMADVEIVFRQAAEWQGYP